MIKYVLQYHNIFPISHQDANCTQITDQLLKYTKNALSTVRIVHPVLFAINVIQIQVIN